MLDMFEPQDHPNDFQFPGGPPIPPYDSAGWTLAYQMGVQFDRVLDNVDGPLVKLGPELIKPAPGRVVEAANAAGYVVSHGVNDAFIAVNRLLKANEEVFFVRDRTWQSKDGSGVMFIAAKPSTLGSAEDRGERSRIDVHGRDAKTIGRALQAQPREDRPLGSGTAARCRRDGSASCSSSSSSRSRSCSRGRSTRAT